MNLNNRAYHAVVNGLGTAADSSVHAGENNYYGNNTYTNPKSESIDNYGINPDPLQNVVNSNIVASVYNERMDGFANMAGYHINDDAYNDIDKLTTMANNHLPNHLIQGSRIDLQVNQLSQLPNHYPQLSHPKFYYQQHNLYKLPGHGLSQQSVSAVQSLPNGVQPQFMRQMPFINQHSGNIHQIHTGFDQNYYHLPLKSMMKLDHSQKFPLDARVDCQQLNETDSNVQKYRILHQQDPQQQQFYPLRVQNQHHLAQVQYDTVLASLPSSEGPNTIEQGIKRKQNIKILDMLRTLAEILTTSENDSFPKAYEIINTLREHLGNQFQDVIHNIQLNTNPLCQSLIHLPFMLWGTNNANYFCEYCVLLFLFKSEKFLSKVIPRINQYPNSYDSHNIKRSINDDKDKNIKGGVKKSKPKGYTPVIVLDYNTEMIESPIIKENPVGMINIGAGSCFLNAIIQCLSNIKPFAIFYLRYKETLPSKESLGFVYEDYIQSQGKSSDNKIGRKVDKYRNCTSFNWEIAIIINYFWRCQTKAIRPEALFNNCSKIIPNFNPREMQDCDEYLQNLLNLLDAELITASKSSEISRVLMEMANVHIPTGINVIFGGMELDNIKCLNCNTINSRLVPYRILTLPMTKIAQMESLKHANSKNKDITKLTKITIQECLDLHFSKDMSLCVSDGEGYDCNVCKSKQNAEKYCNLVAQNLPYVLFITLKRFVCEKETYKIWNPVEFSEILDLTQYIVDYRKADTTKEPRTTTAKRITRNNIPLCARCYGLMENYKSGFKDFKCKCTGYSTTDNRVLYKLIGQVQHDGPSTRQGHYYGYFMHPITGDWYMADDLNVTKQDEVVLAPCPYILIYQRIFTKQFKIEIPSFV